MRDYRISQQWPAVADGAVVPYETFRHRVMDGWDARTAATTPARTYASVMERLWPLIEATPGITSHALLERCPDLTPDQVYYAISRNGKLSRTVLAKGEKGLRPLYAVRIAAKPEPTPTPPVVLRRAPMMDYGSPFARRTP